MSARRSNEAAADKRRLILDAAIRVFAREGFHRCRVSDIAREANVAYGLYPAARGRGYASRAVSLIADFLGSRGARRAVIRVDPDNRRSMQVPVRCGFGKSGTLQTAAGTTLVVFRKALRAYEEPPDASGGSSTL